MTRQEFLSLCQSAKVLSFSSTLFGINRRTGSHFFLNYYRFTQGEGPALGCVPIPLDGSFVCHLSLTVMGCYRVREGRVFSPISSAKGERACSNISFSYRNH